MNTALATASAPATWGYLGNDMESAGRLAKALVGTGLAPAGMTSGQAFYVMLAGAELGLRGPIEALRHVVVIKGKPSISAELMRSLMLQAGCKLDWLRTDATGATLKITRPDGSSGTFTFDEKDAQRANLANNNTWKQYPVAMYQARVTSLAARAFCPDMLRGASYTPEELGVKATVTGEGEIECDAREVTNDHHDDDPKPSGGKALPAPNGNGGEDASGLPEAPANADPTASAAQVKALAILATKKLGGITREGRLSLYAEVIGREIQTSSELTVREWRQVVDALNAMDALPGKDSPTSEAKASGAGEKPASDGNPHGLCDEGEATPSEPSWKKLNPEQSAVRNAIVKLAQSVDWINVQDKTVVAPAAIREAFTVDPGPWLDPAIIATRPAPKRMLALYQQEVEAEQKRQKEGAAA